MSEQFIIPKGGMEFRLKQIGSFLAALSKGRAWRITVEELRTTRSQQQNRYLWGGVYPAILKHLPGWTADDVHEYCLGEWAGWELLEAFGRKRYRPLKRSSKLSKMEFVDYIADIQRRMAERGIYVPDPDENFAEAEEHAA